MRAENVITIRLCEIMSVFIGLGTRQEIALLFVQTLVDVLRLD